MRQSGQIAKYSAAETAKVRLVYFSSFSKEELVIPFLKLGSMVRCLNQLDKTLLRQ
jgi:hypothetical protein